MPKTSMYLSKDTVPIRDHNYNTVDKYFHGHFKFTDDVVSEDNIFSNEELSTIVPKCYRSYAEIWEGTSDKIKL